MAADIAARWENYQSVTVGWGDGDGNPSTGYLANGLVDNHAYTVAWVNYDATGAVVSIVLRNPWGIDTDLAGGVLDGSNDGFVTLTPAQLFAISGRVDYGAV